MAIDYAFATGLNKMQRTHQAAGAVTLERFHHHRQAVKRAPGCRSEQGVQVAGKAAFVESSRSVIRFPRGAALDWWTWAKVLVQAALIL